MKQIIQIAIALLPLLSFAQYSGNTTPTYPELVEIYKTLASKHDEIELYQMGDSDFGLPIYLCVVNGASDSLKTMIKARSHTTVLINNAIHPGEPDGVNACLIWIDNWIAKGKKIKDLPVIGIIPAYNVGGMMNRSGTSRANQDGPEEYGFRGNAQNLDLNRDFIKMDSKNMFTFSKIYHALEPDVFLDTHVSNGADYQYTMTYIASMRERMAPDLSTLMHDQMIPELERYSAKKGYEIVPYVHLKGDVPDKGIEVFNDLPRYAMGYASLFNSISFTLETHMLKPFQERVKSTRVFIEGTIDWISANSKEIESARNLAIEWEESLLHYKYNYRVGEHCDSILFKGFEHSYPISEITGKERLKYHRDRPFERKVPYFNECQEMDSVHIPDFYIIGGQCTGVIEKLRANNVQMEILSGEEMLNLNQYKILKFETNPKPYEGHFPHTEIEIELSNGPTRLKKGDFKITTHQKNRRFILSVLEPDTPDSYFVWNSFDAYVQQKEYFSAYVFEDKAKEILANNAELNQEFEKKKELDSEFRESTWRQLYFVYKNSEFYEPSHNILPLVSGME